MSRFNIIQPVLQSAKLAIAMAGICGIVAVSLASAAHGQVVAVTHCQGECPVYESSIAAQQSRVVIHHLYAAGVNGQTSLPDWVAYRLTGSAVGVASLLPRTWQADRLVRYSPLEDIAQAGEDEVRLSDMITESSNPYGGGAAAVVEPENRARLAPITSFANTPYWDELNNFSNMVPMPASLRLGPWLQLEQRLNRMAESGSELYVVAGPLYLINILNLSPSSTDLEPTAYFKVVADESGIATFLFPNDTDRQSDFCSRTSSLAELQQMSGIELLPGRRRIRESKSLYEGLGCQTVTDELSSIAE